MSFFPARGRQGSEAQLFITNKSPMGECSLSEASAETGGKLKTPIEGLGRTFFSGGYGAEELSLGPQSNRVSERKTLGRRQSQDTIPGVAQGHACNNTEKSVLYQTQCAKGEGACEVT